MEKLASDFKKNLIVRKPKLSKKILLLFFLTPPLSAIAEPTIYQAGTLLDLMNGIYIGSTTFDELAKQGDIGVGTTNGLGGELIEIDNKFYAADENGNIRQVSVGEKTPFTMVTQFKPQQQLTMQQVDNITDFETQLEKNLPSKNLFYVIKVDGKFSSIKARSETSPAKPYQPLDQVMKTNQKIFYFTDMDGSMIIFKSPAFVSPMSVPGYHVHFISADRTKGGHVFDFKITDAKVSIEQVNKFVLELPSSKESTQGNFNPVGSNDIVKVESKRN